MKVVSVSAIIEKYDINDISDFDITYMNKLNESLNATSDLTFKSRENKFNGTADKFEETILLNGYLTEGMKISATNRKNYDCSNVNGHLDEDNRISDENLKSENQSDPESLSNDLEVCGKPCEKVENLSAGDSGLESSISSWDKSVSEIKEHAYKKLEAELQNLREILKLRDEEVINLRKMRQDGDKELLELTASLFEEAHSMVNEANVKRTAAERALRECLMQVDVLTAEVTALKTLVLTSTPSKPNLHLHNKDSTPTQSGNGFLKKHHRSPSHFDLKYGRESSSSQKSSLEDISSVSLKEPLEVKRGYEIDPNFHREFSRWVEKPSLDKDNPFITHMYNKDIDQCLDFNNTTLVAEVKQAIDTESIFIEAVDKAKTIFPKKCALMEVPKLCFYRMKITDADEWHYISQMCRNRIIAVCNFLNYLRYIQRGLVKSSTDDMYWEVVRLRKEMVLATLGLPASSN